MLDKDDDNDSLPSQASSCITTESILMELQDIETTAKLVYQRMVLSSQPGGVDVGQNATPDLFSPEVHYNGGETEVVLLETVATRPMEMVSVLDGGSSGQRNVHTSESETDKEAVTITDKETKNQRSRDKKKQKGRLIECLGHFVSFQRRSRRRSGTRRQFARNMRAP